MVDQQTRDSILEASRSEVKRWGGDGPTLTHAAFIFARRWREDFESVFGVDGRSRVEQLLGARRFRGDESQLRALLEENDVLGAIKAIRAELDVDLEQPAPPATESPQPASDVDATETLPERTRRVVEIVLPVEDRYRQPESAEIAAQVLRSHPTITAIVGDPGVGRTALLGALAARLAAGSVQLPVLRLSPTSVVANPVATIKMVLDDLTEPTVVGVDDLDVLARLGTDAPDRDLLAAIQDAGSHRWARLVLILDKRYLSRLSILAESLHDRLAVVAVTELPPEASAAIVHERATAMAQDRGLVLDPGLVPAALASRITSSRLLHPGLAVDRIDQACARAVVAGSATVALQHLAAEGPHLAVPTEARNLALILGNKVRGQADAIARVARRLTLTRANLDLRPERPNGVFLFVGPTGVGKTELAKEIAVHEYGGIDRLIRLDMSEFAHDWAVSRLVGPMPGYVGSTEPEGWLTTKVGAMPRCVVLLDEIEKAHPRVWNTFLQVFDSGRLTDSRGFVADFSDAVIVMTSNLGVKEAGSRSVGFAEDGDLAQQRLLGVVRDQMAPELLNRMDEIIVFETLSMDSIVEIAQQELLSVQARLSAAGWSVEYATDVAEWLARSGYDPAYGARHLQRNIERELLMLLASAKSRQVAIATGDQGLVATPR